MPANLTKECDNPSCHRKVSPKVQYCCTPCRWAHVGRYLIHSSGPLGHTRECNIRAKTRQDCPVARGNWIQSANQFTIGGKLMHLLLDIKTGQTFSFDKGWNLGEASIRTSEVWAQYIYHARGLFADKSWEGRIFVAVPLPHEQKEYT